jgi:hypothetical protein
MSKILIGIDPDVEKSGFARIEGNQLKLDNLSFFDLYEELKSYQNQVTKPIVYVELGSLNKTNWHSKESKSSKWNSNIGAALGRNFEVANKIVEMCEYLKIPYVKIKPKASKITNDYFKKITGIDTRTNQEQRDAMMLIWGR